MENELLPGDIVSIIVENSFCGLPKGIHQGIIVNLVDVGVSIAFTDVQLAIRAKELGVGQFLDQACWGNFEIVRLIRGENHAV